MKTYIKYLYWKIKSSITNYLLSFKLIAWLKWLIEKRPYITYKGYNCGLCGKWVNKEFSIPEYKSCGRWWDTWGICINCKN